MFDIHGVMFQFGDENGIVAHPTTSHQCRIKLEAPASSTPTPTLHCPALMVMVAP
jgi:hypothetical protein